MLPERGFESIKNFWREYSTKQLEEFLVEAIYYGYDYCLSFKEIPNQEFVARHREKFAVEFEHLESQRYYGGGYHGMDEHQEVQSSVGMMPMRSDLSDMAVAEDELMGDNSDEERELLQ